MIHKKRLPPGRRFLHHVKFQFIAQLDFEICRTSGATAAGGRFSFSRGEAVSERGTSR